jgi:alpha-tubulin suppressor-like RCC1 family protein/photosystem II stability/assembly factor-like uncharacterized protein
MRSIRWKSVVLALVLWQTGSTASIVGDAYAQFLGQQSLSQSSYVIDQSGQLWAWGANSDGQLGVGDRTNRNTPTLVPLPAGASKWVLVAGGANFAIAVADSDKLYAWGLNDKGQTGNGVDEGLYVIPTRIQNPSGTTTWKWVSAGAAHCEALTTDGRLFAWGDNTQGELGAGTTGFVIAPQEVQFPTGVGAWADVAAGPGYTLMIAQDGSLYGCGVDSLGTFEPREGPIQATMPGTYRAFSPLPCLGASYRLESKIDQNNDVSGVPLYQDPIFYISPDDGFIEQIASVADGGYHTLILSMEGAVAATGETTYGQLGLDTTNPNFNSGIVSFPSSVFQVVAIAAGLRHSLAIGDDGWLYSWGDDSLGELGIGAAPNQSAPVRVMKVCPPVSLSGSLSVPTDFFNPYSIKLSVQNASSSSPLTDVDAFLVPGSPLAYVDSTPDEHIPAPINLHGNSSAVWDGALGQPVFDSLYPTYFAYVRAAGSAPLLVFADIVPVVSGPWKVCDAANVTDSLTGIPLTGADLVNPGAPFGMIYSGPPFDSNKMVSNTDGIFSLCFKGPVTAFPVCMGMPSLLTGYPFNLMKENYRTTRNSFSEPIPMNVSFVLGPSEIQGTFAAPAPPFVADSIQKVYYPDSLIGYALSRNVIFRTMDSGISWSALYEADADLHDVKFRDPAHGYVVGDGGEILSTTDSGDIWQITHVGTRSLRALSIIDADDAWAVGDNGTLLEKSGDTWSAEPSLSTYNLTSIHFFDPEHGVIGANGVYYLYNSGTWVRHTINANVTAVYYTAPGQIFFAGENGKIIGYNDTDLGCGGAPIVDSTYTTQTINSLYFLNTNVGYATGDSGASFVTYDAGTSWASMAEFPNSATSMNFFSLAGHGVTDNGVLNYDGEPSTVNSIVRGRITFGNPSEPIMGAVVNRIFVAVVNDTDTVSAYIDNAYTNDQGNFVFTNIDGIFPYEYQINFTDSGIAKSKIFSNVRGRNHEIITLNYNDYAPPAQDTILQDVNSSSQAVLSLTVGALQSFALISFSIPADGPVRLTMQDILGRTVRTISDGFHAQGSSESNVSLDGLSVGAYYVRLETADGSVTKKLVVIR